MSLYSDYLKYNGFTKAAFEQRAAALGYRIAMYRMEPTILIWLQPQPEATPFSLVCFNTHESAALFFEVLEGTITHERIEETFLKRFPTLTKEVSQEIRSSWKAYLPAIAFTPPRRNAQLTWYRGPADWMVYKDHVLSCSSGTVAERLFALFEQEQERQLWILSRHGERLAINQTMHRLSRLDGRWFSDMAEHYDLAQKQVATYTEWLDV